MSKGSRGRKGDGQDEGRAHEAGPERQEREEREEREARLDRIFFALSDRTRRAILAQLAEGGEVSVSELAAPHAMSLPAVMKHLAVLGEAGLTSEGKEGRVRRCQLDPAALAVASEFLAAYKRFWEDQFDALERYLATLDDPAPGGSGPEEDPT